MKINLVEHNPQLKKPVACMLGLAESNVPCDRRNLESLAAENWDEVFAQTPGAVCDMLVRSGAFTEQVFVEGERYSGTLESIQLDESIPLTAHVEVRLDLTADGRELACSIDPARTVSALFSERPHYRAVFARVIEACNCDQGASRNELEAAVEAQGAPKSPKGERVYPQFFIDALESAGAIEWKDSWRATDAGIRALG